MAPILQAAGLTKAFKTTKALAGLDLTAERGQVTAVLGPNGAGKTTFIRMVATLLRPDRGSLHVPASMPSGNRPRYGGPSGWRASRRPSKEPCRVGRTSS